jgi:hypothetical protein
MDGGDGWVGGEDPSGWRLGTRRVAVWTGSMAPARIGYVAGWDPSGCGKGPVGCGEDWLGRGLGLVRWRAGTSWVAGWIRRVAFWTGSLTAAGTHRVAGEDPSVAARTGWVGGEDWFDGRDPSGCRLDQFDDRRLGRIGWPAERGRAALAPSYG